MGRISRMERELGGRPGNRIHKVLGPGGIIINLGATRSFKSKIITNPKRPQYFIKSIPKDHPWITRMEVIGANAEQILRHPRGKIHYGKDLKFLVDYLRRWKHDLNPRGQKVLALLS